MIKAEDAIRTARSLIGTPYKELDCVNLVKKVIRTTTGGVPGYTTAGTNTLWRSYNATRKYRDLTWRQDGIAGARAGMLAFKASGDNVHHVGLVTGEGTVIHASSAAGETVETTLDRSWDLLGIHRYIETTPMGAMKEEKSMYKAVVNTQRDPLRVREWPKTGAILGSVPRGKVIDVLEDAGDGWPKIRYNELVGYVSGEYLLAATSTPVEDAEETEVKTIGEVTIRTIVEDSTGRTFEPIGGFSVRTVLEVDGEAID